MPGFGDDRKGAFHPAASPPREPAGARPWRSVANRTPLPAHPATVAQPKPAFGRRPALPAHPAAAAQAKPSYGRGGSLPPHPATVVLPGSPHPARAAVQRAKDDSLDAKDDAGQKTVFVQPWLVRMTYHDGTKATAEDIQLDSVLEAVHTTWAQAKIDLSFRKPEVIAVQLERELKKYDLKKPSGTTEFMAELESKVGPAIEERVLARRESGKEEIHVVYTPTYDKWGYMHRGSFGKSSAFLAFVATHNAGVGLTENVPREAPTKDHPAYHRGIALDTAHEIGHGFGLEHLNPDTTNLMLTGLYNTIISVEKSEDGKNAIQFASKRPGYEASRLIRTLTEISGVVKEAWVLLHGDRLTAKQIEDARGGEAFKRLTA